MFGLRKIAAAIEAYGDAIDEAFLACGAAGRANMASAMRKSVVAELLALVTMIENDVDLPAVPADTVYVDGSEKNLDNLLGKGFMRRVRDLKDLGSATINEIVNAAAAIGDTAKEDRKPFKDPKQEDCDVVSVLGLKLLAVHFVSDDLQNHGCALERTFGSLFNHLVGARLTRLAQRLERDSQSKQGTATVAGQDQTTSGAK